MESSSAYAIAGAVVLIVLTTLYFLAGRMKQNQRLKELEDQQKDLLDRLNRAREQPYILPTREGSQAPQVNHQLQVEEPEPIVIPATQPPVDDSKLKRVSIATNNFLFNASFAVDDAVKRMLYTLKSKYRIFLITQVDSEASEQHKQAQERIADFVKDGVV
jgi:hypothetical protein